MAKYKKKKGSSKGKGKGKGDPFYRGAQVHGSQGYEMSLDTGWGHHGHGDGFHGPAMSASGGAGSHKVRGLVAPPPRPPRRP